MRKFLKCMLAILIVGAIGVIAFGASYYLYNNSKISSTSNNGQNSNSSSNEVTSEPKKEEVKEEKKNEEQNVNEQKNEVVIEEESTSEEDKAIDLAKKEYGSSNGVYFRIEQPKGNGVYEISVRDSETTRDIVWYTVDVKNGTVK